tara:strand:- start:133 stop:669 length:537 start_codon:yes stop_codon:yes gene_type:complete
MSNSNQGKTNDVPTLLVQDSKGSELLCYLEQIVPIKGIDYVLLTPVDTPVCLFQLQDNQDPRLIKTIESSEPILDVADVVLQEHELTLIRSAVTLTVAGELEEPDSDELEEDDYDDDTETYELLVSFKVENLEYGLYIPLDPFFIVGKLKEGQATVVEGDEFDKIQPIIESELEDRDL